jgi:hypothetical protein
MSTTYTWKVLNLETIASVDNLANIVSVVRWLITGADGTNTATVEGTAELDLPASEGFIEYASLNEEQVLTWAKEKLGAELENKYYQYLDQQLVKLAKPETAITELPWA